MNKEIWNSFMSNINTDTHLNQAALDVLRIIYTYRYYRSADLRADEYPKNFDKDKLELAFKTLDQMSNEEISDLAIRQIKRLIK